MIKYLSISSLAPFILSILVVAPIFARTSRPKEAIQLYFALNSLFLAVLFPIISIDAFYYQAVNNERIEDVKILKDLSRNKVSAYIEVILGLGFIYCFMIYGHINSMVSDVYNAYNILELIEIAKLIEKYSIFLGLFSLIFKIVLMKTRKMKAKKALMKRRCRRLKTRKCLMCVKYHQLFRS